MNSERGALVRGSDPPSGYSVLKTIGDRWWASARRLIQHIWALLCRKQATNILELSPMAKIGLFSGVGEERWTPRATPGPLDHGST